MYKNRSVLSHSCWLSPLFIFYLNKRLNFYPWWGVGEFIIQILFCSEGALGTSGRGLTPRNFNSHLQHWFDCFVMEAGGTEPDWTMFCTSIAENPARLLAPVSAVIPEPDDGHWSWREPSCRRSLTGLYYSVGLQKEITGAGRTSGVRLCKNLGLGVQWDNETWLLVSVKAILAIVRWCRRGKRYSTNIVHSVGGKLLTLTGVDEIHLYMIWKCNSS